MTKYPKAWLAEVSTWFRSYKAVSFPDAEKCAFKVLNSLEALGALKEPPKPREWWLCPMCSTFVDYDNSYHNGVNAMGKEYTGVRIRVREVLENDE